MIEWLESIDQQVTLFLNGFHHPIMDQVMWIITIKYTWIPLYLFIIYQLFKAFNNSGWYWLVGIILLVIATDQLTSSVIKPFFGRLRPCHDPEINYLIHNFKKCGGLYSFVSGHSANSFAIATFVFLLFKNRFTKTWVIFIWAIIIAYSRVYLGVHYMGDIVVGGTIGAVLGIGFFLGVGKMVRQRANYKDS
jgi:undecaprenyl-diphosphatase